MTLKARQFVARTILCTFMVITLALFGLAWKYDRSFAYQILIVVSVITTLFAILWASENC